VGESGKRRDVEDRERVFPFVHASCGEDDGDEVDAGVSEERQGGGFGEELDIDAGDVADDVVVLVDDR
jgi:hypothetical protein